MSDATERAIRYLARSPLLQGVGEEILRVIEPPPEMLSLKAGETLIRQDERNTDYFVLVSGRLRVLKEENGARIPIGTVLPGEGVGEMALLTNEPRMATVIARLDSEVVRFPQSTFLTLAGGQPLTVLNIARSVISRSKRPATAATNRISDYPSIAILPLTRDIDAAALAKQLAGALEVYGRSCVVHADFEGASDKLEEQFDFLIYEAGSEANEWSRSCALRADLALFAAAVNTTSEPTKIEQQLLPAIDLNILGRIDLLMVGTGSWQRHSNAASWIARVKPREHHHLRLGNPGDIARLARVIAGRANNLVLSGGGVRAFAQIGAIRALEQFRIPIDRITGCSMGAAVGAMRALDDGFEGAVRQARELFLRRQPTRDLTLPLLSLISGKRLTDIAIELFGDWRIEDLPTRYFCISSDLDTGEIIEHFDGPVWQALRATAAIPVMAPPLLREGRFLVDGGVLNNLPIDIMRQHFSGAVLAIDVSPNERLRVDSRWEMKCPSGFEILREGLTLSGHNAGIPSIFEVLRRTVTLASERQAQQARPQADLLLTPPVSKFGLTEFPSFDQIVDIGYQHTMRILQELEDAHETDPRIARK